jgi:hypothetical protein
MSRALGAAEVAAKLAPLLEKAKLPYAIGGALAYGRYGVPRTTLDVDFNVFVDVADAARVVAVLKKARVVFADDVLAQAEREGMFIGDYGHTRVDVFLASIPFSREAAKTRVRLREGRRSLWFLAPEAIAVFKLLFFRGKDVIDLERLVATMGKQLDVAYVRKWIVEMMGDDDERTLKWDAIVATYR